MTADKTAYQPLQHPQRLTPAMSTMLAKLSRGEVRPMQEAGVLQALARRKLAYFTGKGSAARWRLTDKGKETVCYGRGKRANLVIVDEVTA